MNMKRKVSVFLSSYSWWGWNAEWGEGGRGVVLYIRGCISDMMIWKV